MGCHCFCASAAQCQPGAGLWPRGGGSLLVVKLPSFCCIGRSKQRPDRSLKTSQAPRVAVSAALGAACFSFALGQWGSARPAAVGKCILGDRALHSMQPESAEGKEAGEWGQGAKTLKSANLIFLKLTWHKLQQRSVAGTWNRGRVGRPSCCFSSLPWDSNCLLPPCSGRSRRMFVVPAVAVREGTAQLVSKGGSQGFLQ